MTANKSVLRAILNELYVHAKKAYAEKNEAAQYVVDKSWDAISEKLDIPTCTFRFLTSASKAYKAWDYETAKQAHFIEWGKEFESDEVDYMKSYKECGDSGDFLIFNYELDYNSKTGFSATFRIKNVEFIVYLSDAGEIMDFSDFGDYYEGELHLHEIAEKIQSWKDVFEIEKQAELTHKREVENHY